MDFDEFRVLDTRRFVDNLEDALAHARPGGTAPPVDAIEGSDASGTVHCVVTLDGTLSRVGITDGWWSAVGPRGVAAAVLQAFQFARDKAAFGRMVLARHGHPYPPVVDAVPGLGEPLPEPPFDGPDAAHALRRKVDRAAADLAEAVRWAREAGSHERREVAGPRGLFRVELAGATVVGARVDEAALRPGDADELAADARDALLAARLAGTSHGER